MASGFQRRVQSSNEILLPSRLCEVDVQRSASPARARIWLSWVPKIPRTSGWTVSSLPQLSVLLWFYLFTHIIHDVVSPTNVAGGFSYTANRAPFDES